MSCASEGGRPKRGPHKTKKYQQYSLELLWADSKRIIRRLQNQKTLFGDLMQTSNVEMMNREVAKLDEIQNQLLETYAQIREIVHGIDASKEDEEQLKNLIKVVDEEDTAVFQIKKDVSVWMIQHCEEFETGSVKSNRSGRSKNSSQRSERSGSVRSSRSGSVHSGRSVRSVSNESIRSVKSDGSRASSRVSKKAKVAGLKAEVMVLKKEGKREITEEVHIMKQEIKKYEKEQGAILQAEITKLQDQIIQQDEQYLQEYDTEDIPSCMIDEKMFPDENIVEDQVDANKVLDGAMKVCTSVSGKYRRGG